MQVVLETGSGVLNTDRVIADVVRGGERGGAADEAADEEDAG